MTTQGTWANAPKVDPDGDGIAVSPNIIVFPADAAPEYSQAPAAQMYPAGAPASQGAWWRLGMTQTIVNGSRLAVLPKAHTITSGTVSCARETVGMTCWKPNGTWVHVTAKGVVGGKS